MAVYKISDILLKLGEMIEDGHAFVELDEYPKEDDSPALLSFNVPVECESPDFDVSDYESIDACNPNDPSSNEIISISPDSLCPDLLFTYNEIDLIFGHFNLHVDDFTASIVAGRIGDQRIARSNSFPEQVCF